MMTTISKILIALLSLTGIVTIVRHFVGFEIVFEEDYDIHDYDLMPDPDTPEDSLIVDCPQCGMPAEVAAMMLEWENSEEVTCSYLIMCISESHDPIVLSDPTP